MFFGVPRVYEKIQEKMQQVSYFYQTRIYIYQTLKQTLFEVIAFIILQILQVGQANKGLKRQIGNWAKKTGLKRNRTLIEQNRRQASGM